MVNTAAHSKLNAKSAQAEIVTGLCAGFSLVELVVTIAVVGILASIAIPSFSGMIANNKARGVATDLYFDLAKARSEAVKRNRDVTMSPTDDGWKKGWNIYPTNQSDNILESHSVSGANVSVSGPGSVKYNSSGRIGGSVSFGIEATVGSASANSCVTVSLSGLPNVKNSAC
jgi:type IV fimbrial biogenesis protein FimT